ncbi:peptide chain release factor 2 [Thermodesulfovibrionales bacterium]|nr:peptide chain release factor 2 [Thermodesulfovibrionales bacterium]
MEKELSSEDVWNFPDSIKQLQKTKAEIEATLYPLEIAIDKILYIEDSINVLREEGGDIFIDEIKSEIEKLRVSINDLEIKALLPAEIDKNNAIVVIHPGAGGVESQDWAQILIRMYLRWAENNGFKTEIIDIQTGEDAGIKGVTFHVEGRYVYGYLKSEVGIHRLVRISPFDTNKRRHTSFSSIFVYPEIEDDVKIEVKDEDVKIDTFRSSGAGGQSVNKVSSAVRITHIHTGIVVSCQKERSQHRNKEIAMKVLKSRLYDVYCKEKEKKLENIVGNKKEISWGNQIRSYVLHPYRMVKDHRTNVEVGNVDAVFDGGIDIFIKGYLELIAKSGK